MKRPRNARPRAKAHQASQSRANRVPFLLEIGTEELPSAFLPQALQDLAELGQRLLAESRLTFGNLRTVGTPRRLSLLVDDVQTQQDNLTLEIVGPPAAAAFDATGQPTKAAHGFAKSQGSRPTPH